VGFVVDKLAFGQVFSEYFGFPCQFSLHNHPHLQSGAGTIGQKWPQYQVDLVPPREKKKNILEYCDKNITCLVLKLAKVY
jgi:hypothetical protein